MRIIILFFVKRLLYIAETVLIATSAFWWAGRKKQPARILGCVEPEKNPLPAQGGVRAQGICAAGPEQSGEAIFLREALFFAYFFLGQQKKVSPPEGLG